MADFDYVIPGIVVSKSDVILELQELYDVVKDWFSFQKYDVLEKEHVKQPKGTLIKWESEKKIDDYIKFVIKVSLVISDEKEVIVKEKGREKNKQKANVKFYIESFLEKDYENKWEKTPWQQFIRGFYDRFLISSKMNKMADELRAQTTLLRDEIKAYLNIQKL